MGKLVLTRYTSDSLGGRRLMGAKGSRVADGEPNLSKAQLEWNKEVEAKRKQKKEKANGQ